MFCYNPRYLRRFIRGIFTPFLYSFYPHANSVYNVQNSELYLNQYLAILRIQYIAYFFLRIKILSLNTQIQLTKKFNAQINFPVDFFPFSKDEAS